MVRFDSQITLKITASAESRVLAFEKIQRGACSGSKEKDLLGMNTKLSLCGE